MIRKQARKTSSRRANVGPYRWVDTEAGLRSVVETIRGEPRVALDTEFHRERTFWPQVALIQIAWPGDLVLIDPLAVNVAPLGAIFDDTTLVVAHAAGQDFEILKHCCNKVPERLFDTQIAAGFVGLGTPSLATLHEAVLGKKITKSHRLTDWLARPLDEAQMDYAAGDVADLLEIHDSLAAQLEELGRVQWAEDEFRVLADRANQDRRPEDAWQRVKDVRRLRGQALAVARSVATWRENRAANADQPVRHVLSDLAVVSIAAASPRNVADLAAVRGVGEGLARGKLGARILRAVAEGLDSDWRPPVKKTQPAAELPTVSLVSAWVRQLAKERKLEASLLATRADIEAFVREEPDCRLRQGWRATMVGEPLQLLMSGKAALAFNDGTIVLEHRSHKPVTA